MQAIQSQENTRREALYSRLMALAQGVDNDDTIACIYASWACGDGALPDRLGLDSDAFTAMMAFHFPGLEAVEAERGMPVAEGRSDEMEELHRLLVSQRAGRSPSEIWMAGIVVAACLGNDHLWQDLGLWSRRELSELMTRNFPLLAARNDKDMKWKKFLYKQLCETEGIYTCRAPSCQECNDYAACFGPEE